ncbi:hypothetical protein [Pontibacter actiniarum]|uniref:Uncharacterized protein n=1 Tax=Pontibacter actiniarum TaxID=323450 RepID=A0A1X9YQ19_9BACT|nr:hypothetical protein [Pontibacter actiniarum]ARS34957.1 hypothetical protein CA264_05600 [Pontibacter actiniarum]
MLEQQDKDVVGLALNTPKEVELDEGELLKVAEEKRHSAKGWWILFTLYSAVWLLYPFIGPKGGPAPIRRMAYAEALVAFIWPHLILSAVTYYCLIIRMNADVRSRSKQVLKTTITKVSKGSSKNKITLYTSNRKPEHFTVNTSGSEIDTSKPIILHYLKRTKTILRYSQPMCL